MILRYEGLSSDNFVFGAYLVSQGSADMRSTKNLHYSREPQRQQIIQRFDKNNTPSAHSHKKVIKKTRASKTSQRISRNKGQTQKDDIPERVARLNP